MKKNDKYKQLSINEAAPALLLDLIAELRGTLVKLKSSPRKNPNQEQWLEKIINTSQFSWAYMAETQYIRERNIMLESQIRHLSWLNQQLEDKLKEYQVVQRLVTEDRLNDILTDLHPHIKEHLKKCEKIKNNGSN